MAVRQWQLTESVVASWQSTAPYLFDATQKTTALLSNYTPASVGMAFYEVTAIDGSGSWLLATVASNQTPSGWTTAGGVVQLQASGDEIPTTMNGQPVMRPAVMYWWVPTTTLASITAPVVVLEGEILGAVPVIPPDDVPTPPQITIQRTDNGVILTIPPTTSNTTILVRTDS